MVLSFCMYTHTHTHMNMHYCIRNTCLSVVWLGELTVGDTERSCIQHLLRSTSICTVRNLVNNCINLITSCIIIEHSLLYFHITGWNIYKVLTMLYFQCSVGSVECTVGINTTYMYMHVIMKQKCITWHTHTHSRICRSINYNHQC